MYRRSKASLLLSTIKRHGLIGLFQNTSSRWITSKASTRAKFPSKTSNTSPIRSKPEETQHSPGSSEPQARPHSKYGLLRDLLFHPRHRYKRRVILAAPALLLACLHSPYEVLTVNGASMAPFLNPNTSDSLPTKDKVLVQRWHSQPSDRTNKQAREGESTTESSTDFYRGQIVVFNPPHNPRMLAVKRVVGVPGDMVQPLSGYAGGDSPVVVPWNHLWVEGDADARDKSMDSNWYGPISQNLILGEVRAVMRSWWNWDWLDFHQHSWPARQRHRIEENVVSEAAVDPDAVTYNSGWKNGSIALILERIRKQPEHLLHAFVNDAKNRQETRRLYNNALYVAQIATSEQERILAGDLLNEMEDLYGRQALVFGIRMKKQPRARGDTPNSHNSRIGESPTADPAASDAERWLNRQGWQLDKDANGKVKTGVPSTA